MWSYQYTLARILDLTVEEMDLEEVGRRGKNSVNKRIQMLEKAIELDLQKDEEEAEKVFKQASQWSVSEGKDIMRVPDCCYLPEGGRREPSDAVEVSQVSSPSTQHRGFLSTVASWFTEPKTKTD